MRIERNGHGDLITPRIKQFLVEVLQGVDMDKVDAHDIKRIDYSCLEGLFAVELKTLEEDPSHRLENYTRTLRMRSDYPAFWGDASISTIANKMENPEHILNDFTNRIGRSIRNHLKHAREQFRAHDKNHPRDKIVKTIILINEDHSQYSPDIVREFLSKELASKDERGFVYDTIDMVWFLTERHATLSDGLLAFPMIAVEGPNTSQHQYKRDLIVSVMAKWAEFNGYSTISPIENIKQFSPMADVPDAVSRSEYWLIEYQRNPYLSNYTDNQLREAFDEAITLQRTLFVKVPTQEIKAIRSNLPHASLVHITSEMTRRGITPDDFRPTKKRAVAAARRLNLPNSYIRWLRSHA